MQNRSIIFLKQNIDQLTEIYNERFIDWVEAGKLLRLQMAEHRIQYKQKICSKCTQEQKIKRNCIEYVAGGKTQRQCNHMVKAIGQKFWKQNKAHWASHPALFDKKIRKNTVSST